MGGRMMLHGMSVPTALILMLLTLGGLAGCAPTGAAPPAGAGVPSGSTESQASSPARLSPIKLGINKLGAVTDVWLAEKNGIFKKLGLDVELVEISSPTQNIAALQAKSVDIVLQIPGTFMVAKEQ